MLLNVLQVGGCVDDHPRESERGCGDSSQVMRGSEDMSAEMIDAVRAKSSLPLNPIAVILVNRLTGISERSKKMFLSRRVVNFDSGESDSNSTSPAA